MTDSHRNHDKPLLFAEKGSNSPTPAPRTQKRVRKSLSMHEGIAVWCDCCSCEAEPYWAAVAEETGIDPVSGYQDDDTQSLRHD